MVGRTKLVTPVIVEPDLDQPRIENAMVTMRQEGQSLSLAESQHAATVRAVAAQVGYQLPAECVDPDLIQRDISANMRRSVEACLEVGRGLTVLKAACQHGMFMARLDVLGIDRSVAVRFMQAAHKFSNVASTHHLTKAIGNQTKLFEMLVLDDEQLEELELTGQTGELKLDDVATMSVKELRAKVRELKGEVESKEGLLTTRSKNIDALEERLARMKKAPPDEVRLELQRNATSQFNDALGAVKGTFSDSIRVLVEHARETGTDADTAFMAGLVGEMQAAITTLRDTYGIPDIAPALIPDWVNDPAFENFAE